MKHVYILFLLFLLFSCTKELDDSVHGEEIINGFEVRWRNTITSKQQEIVRNILSNMVKVRGGTFVMGATPEQMEYARSNEYPLCYVRLSDFYICRYEITDEQFITIYSDLREGTSDLSLNWDDWQSFLNVLNEISGVDFDLPTEAQWEYAARGGEMSKGYLYPGGNVLEEVWTDSKVQGSQIPNELGLYNMADMKSEWCKDCFYEYELGSNELLIDPIMSDGKHRIVRGGNYHCGGNAGSKYNKVHYLTSTYSSFGHFKTPGSSMEPFDYRYCRTTARSFYYVPDNKSRYIGCRLVINF